MGYTTPYVVRMLAQVEFNQLGFNSNGDFEDFIQHNLIPQADKRIDSFCNHSFGTPTIGTWSLDGTGNSVLFMPTERCPVIGISAGSINSSAVTVSSIKVHDQYLQLDGGVWSEGKKNVTLAGSYGYASFPNDVGWVSAQICANILLDMVRKKVLPDLIQREEGGVIITSTKSFNKEIQETLEPYVFTEVSTG